MRVDEYPFLTYSLTVPTVVETESYLRDARATGVTDPERLRIVDFIAANPDAGKEIIGTGGARKVRFAG